MRRILSTLCGVALAFCGLASPAGAASLGLSEFDVAFTGPNGETVTQAGAHPFAMTTSLKFNTEETTEGAIPAESAKDLLVSLASGFAGDQGATPPCATLDFLVLRESIRPAGGGLRTPKCADGTAVGIGTLEIGEAVGMGSQAAPVYNLEPAPGEVARLGMVVQSVPVTIDVRLSQTPPYRLVATASSISQVLEVFGAHLVIWGVPADPAHDDERGRCFENLSSFGIHCPAEGAAVKPFLTMPRSCTGPLETRFELDSWQHPGLFVEGATSSEGMSECADLELAAGTSTSSSSHSTETASGLGYAIDVEDEGLKEPEGRAHADISMLRTVFPPGMTVNPSAANGLGACTHDQFQSASISVTGCPEDAKVGTLETATPLLEGAPLRGDVYVAQPDDATTPQAGAENPFDSLLALYLIVRDPERGIFIKLPARIETDERTGQLTTILKDLPPFPLGHVEVQLREGPRAPLITPSTCGSYRTTTTFFPSSGGQPLVDDSSITIDSGVGGGPCPSSPLPFAPGFTAGSQGDVAGSFSPFLIQLTREDGQQDITRFSATLPGGVVPRLAGVAQCSDAQIAAARGVSGRGELATASCPSGSQIGTVSAGAGVGSALTYVAGKVYLSGPFGGDPLSAVAIVPAVAGPFDLGNVVTRTGLRINPETYVGEIDISAAESIPHILKGVPLRLRDLRIDVDRPGFMKTPTNCEATASQAAVFGSYLDVLSPVDDISVNRASPYQVGNCRSLTFRPKLTVTLKGKTGRVGHPALIARLDNSASGANVAGAVVALPHSEFLEQGHIRTICTRVQFAAHQCPPGSVYGSARAETPLLDGPLSGPVYLRSSNHALPDLVVALRGPASTPVEVNLVGRIDSVHGGIRTSFETAPDAPVSSFVLKMQGGKKGLLVNSRNICLKRKRNRADVSLNGQNGRISHLRPVLQVRCGKGKTKKHRHRHHR
jgi:hypothetical protein